MKKIYLLFSIWLVILPFQVNGDEITTITFPSLDGVEITADTFIEHDKKAPFIVLFHQAGWSRGEYLEIAPKLNQLGFNCMAVDLRSGDTVNGVNNETAKNALQSNKQTRYVEALPDMVAALRYAKSKYSDSKIIAWGSSYSAALVLQIAGTEPDLVDGVMAFAPGEYFAKQGKSSTWIKESVAGIKVPVLITSARNEEKNWISIFKAINSDQKTAFISDSKGNHGSRALWKQFDDSDQYWNAVNQFLTIHFI